MKESYLDRVISEAKHIIKTRDTVRKTARIFGVSKSTVHSDVSIKLRAISPTLYMLVRPILDENFADKHNRGGRSTKEKYLREEFIKNQERE